VPTTQDGIVLHPRLREAADGLGALQQLFDFVSSHSRDILSAYLAGPAR
jgi:hypothetical protein